MDRKQIESCKIFQAYLIEELTEDLIMIELSVNNFA